MLDKEALKNGDRKCLAKAITLAESKIFEKKDYICKLIKDLKNNNNLSKKIGITGAPGVGKSTFINRIGNEIIKDGSKLAILTIDPSSPVNNGSILGDKIRMSDLCFHNNVYIRSSPGGNSIGGITDSTKDLIEICEIAGFDYIIVETIGVGQSEYKITEIIDKYIILIEPGQGDAIQFLKKGYLELADLIIINKCDGERIHLGEQTYCDYNNSTSLSLNIKKRQKLIKLSSITKSNANEFDEIIKILNEQD